MASFVYNRAAKEILDGTIDLVAHTIKVMLVTSSYVANRDNDFVDAGGANDPIDHELSGTGYGAGFGGSGRKTLSNKAFSEDDPNDRGEFDNTLDLTWTGINAGTWTCGVTYGIGTLELESNPPDLLVHSLPELAAALDSPKSSA